MKVDLQYLKRQGIWSGAYKPLFTAEPGTLDPKVDTKIQKLITLIRDRIRRGTDYNLANYQPYAAIDLAFNAPFNQTTPTIINSILSQKLDAEKTLAALRGWGLNEKELFNTVQQDGKEVKLLNPPVFFTVLIPLVRAYCEIRAAKLYNDRNQSPLLPYYPLKRSATDRVLCEIVTDMVEHVNSGYGYQTTLRSAILHMLKYGNSVAFPMEEWHVEKQVSMDAFGKAKRTVIKEGIRYTFPHPTRMFWDMFHPLTSINTDTGCEFLGHWRLMRYSDILDDRMYWNRNKVYYGRSWYELPGASNYFQEVYPCQMQFPSTGYFRQNNRENEAQRYSYSQDRDMAVMTTRLFMKIVPWQFGLGNYKYPVWHCFEVANDDTVLWCSPCAYTPAWMMGYDYDDQSSVQSSMALEAMPFQDHVGNILTQMVLTAKQNLLNLTYYDTNLVDRTDVRRLENLGERMYRSLNFIPYDSMKLQRMGINAREAFTNITFPYRDIQPLVQTLGSILNIMERVLQMSAQEVGTTAQHYQSAREISVTANATSNRLAFTGSYVDDGIDAWKRQLYDAIQAYGDTSILAEISEDIPDLMVALEKLGFSTEGKNGGKVAVRGKLSAVRLDTFARTETRPDREANSAMAQVIYQMIGVLAGNEMLFEKVGVDNVLDLLEEAAKLAGGDNTFKLRRDNAMTPSQMQQWVMQQVKSAQEELLKGIEQNVVQPAVKVNQKQDGEIQQMQEVMKKLERVFGVVEKMADKSQLEAQKTQQEIAIAAEQHEAEQRREEEAHDAEQRRKEEAADLELKLKEEKTKSDLQIAKQVAAAKVKAAKSAKSAKVGAK